ncbi:ribonuclease domain-containing protein [Chryseobacterium sp. CFBP8996]|uniref:ribonuclease domain-containing protein n=1 Tax=Chryseobacterium sp. CFBP8996 TaxID=3096529 RepID=UPI002A6B3A4A|nr:ribonuclease domain-containing protein [Chryseobacterium sp. CFBP8996]MDY0930815.1 ribonuclease domain-containing protein [Chryseobacterium sp. CFBP8996]
MYIDPNGKQTWAGAWKDVPKDQVQQVERGYRESMKYAGYSADFVPVAGDAKGIVEGLVGTDLQGNKLSESERSLSLMGLSEIKASTHLFALLSRTTKIVKELAPLKKGVFNNAKLRRVNDLLGNIKSGKIEGKLFRNDGTDGSQILPKKGKNGNIQYTEYDLNTPPTAEQRVNGATRDKERILTGSDGSVWHTTTHYKVIKKISK